jgi:hypothetical protein
MIVLATNEWHRSAAVARNGSPRVRSSAGASRITPEHQLNPQIANRPSHRSGNSRLDRRVVVGDCESGGNVLLSYD